MPASGALAADRLSTQLVNQVRGFWRSTDCSSAACGSVADISLHCWRTTGTNSRFLRGICSALYEELVELETKIASADQRIERAFRENAECRRIAAVEGIGPVTATAVVAAISDAHAFRNGDSSPLGWVWCRDSTPAEAKQNCWDQQTRRSLSAHAAGAWSQVGRLSAKTKIDCRSRWINDKQQRLGTARACVALANKNARILWSLIAKQQVYRPLCKFSAAELFL